jgi:hypothetical protein
MNFTMADNPGMDYIINECSYGGNEEQQGTEAAVSSYQRMNHKQQQEQLPPPLAQVLSSLSQCPPPNATLEQILGVGQSYRQLPSLEAYDMVTSDIPHDPNHSKVRPQ